MTRTRLSWWSLYAEPVLAIAVIAVTVVMYTHVSVADTGSTDFTLLHDSARWLRDGVNPYQTRPGLSYNLNAPATVLLLVPLSYFPEGVALRMWTVLALSAYGLVAYWIAREIAPDGL